MSLDLLKQTELHVHVGGCLTVPDIVDLARDVYRQVDWSVYLKACRRLLGERVDPVSMFEQAVEQGQFETLRQAYVMSASEGGCFDHFMIRFDLLLCLLRHLRQKHGHQRASLEKMVERHQRQGVRYVEYRALYNPLAEDDAFVSFHREIAQFCQEVSSENFIARYIISLPRDRALACYRLVKQMLDVEPGLCQTVVGLDFCAQEQGHPPKQLQDFFRVWHQDQASALTHASLAVVYHVGECFFDKSLESAIRWCHEAALMGATRLGHAIALGLDPAKAIARCPNAFLNNPRDSFSQTLSEIPGMPIQGALPGLLPGAGAHQVECVSERLDQIAYDLKHERGLKAHGVTVDRSALLAEQRALNQRDASETVERFYDAARLDQARQRQDYVLSELARLNVVIETCPTSNLRIGGIKSPEDHPVHRFLSSDVNLAICADDPGIFDTTLAQEVDWVLHHSGWDESVLMARLGDPRRFALDFQE